MGSYQSQLALFVLLGQLVMIILLTRLVLRNQANLKDENFK